MFAPGKMRAPWPRGERSISFALQRGAFMLPTCRCRQPAAWSHEHLPKPEPAMKSLKFAALGDVKKVGFSVAHAAERLLRFAYAEKRLMFFCAAQMVSV